ncbi:MAG: DUF1493 family protein [Chitinophagaceae bacterium]
MCQKTGIKESFLTPQTTIADLKIDGDDVKDLLLDFFKTYNIQCDFSELEKYLPLEGGFGSSTIKSLYNYMQGKKPAKSFEDYISLRDLEDSLINKKWILDKYYPENT